jgi:GTP-binding protein Era
VSAPASRAGFVALVGWTNVGKSTLLNRLVGEKVSAVAEVPQTTRNRIVGVRTLPGRGQVVLVDTPGLHRPRYRMNRNMVRLAADSLRAVDLGLLVIDAARGIGPGDEQAAEILDRARKPSLAVLNKIDRLRSKSSLLPMIETAVARWGMAEAIPVSALTGEGCEEFLERVVAHLPEGEAIYPEGAYTDQPERALATEWVREKLLRHTRQEIPHALAVEVDRWVDRDDGLVEIEATVLVERESHKAIVIGRGGQLLKQVGIEARADLEELLGTRVFLRLWVKVRPGWRDHEPTLKRLGLD